MRLATGGPLNPLNESNRLNQRENSVFCMGLVKAHQPKNPKEMRTLIERHYTNVCTCGIKSKGTVEQFALNLLNAQLQDDSFRAKHGIFSYDRCYEFQFDLFCVGPLMGRSQEMKSRKICLHALSDKCVKVREVSDHEECGCAIDYVLCHDSFGDLLGVQVKPATCPPNVLRENTKKQRKAEFDTLFHCYDQDGTFDGDETKRIKQKVEAIIAEKSNSAP